MAFCANCGTQFEDGTKFCPSCGAPTAAPAAQAARPVQPQAQAQTQVAANSNNTLMGVLAYLSLLVLIPIFTEKENKFIRFHCNQGLVNCIFTIAYYIVAAILSTIFTLISWRLSLVLSPILYLIGLFFAVLAILGIVNVVGGKEKELPLLGKIKILK